MLSCSSGTARVFKGCLSRKRQVPAGLYCSSCVYASYVAGSVHLPVCVSVFICLLMVCVVWQHTIPCTDA